MYNISTLNSTTLLKLKEGDVVYYEDDRPHYQTIRELFWTDDRIFLELDNNRVFGFNF